MSYQVTNQTGSALRGRFAAEDYVFPPDKPVEISKEAAVHIFGLGQSDKTRALNCLGILVGKVTYEEALAVLQKVRFSEGHMVYEAQQQGPGGGQQNPGQPGQQQPGQKPGEHHPGQKPGEKERGPGKDEEHEESEESGGRPGAPRSPGRKSEGEGSMHTSPSDDHEPVKRKW